MTDIETRTGSEVWPLADFDIRTTGNGLHFSGYAAVFDSPSQPLPFIETIRQGAFSKTLSEKRSKRLYWQHDSRIVLGSTKGGTLTLAEDGKGLRAEADLPDNEWGRPVADALKRGDVDSMSFGFAKVRDEWPDGDHRDLIECRLFEVSIVTDPAYLATSASVRALPGLADLPSDLSEAIRDLVEHTGPLSEAQVALLHTVIDERRQPVSRLAEWQGAFAALR